MPAALHEILEEADVAGNLTKEFIFFGGKRLHVAIPPRTVHYYFSDHLGSTDLVTDALGTMSACPGNASLITGEQESDYYPFGGERVLCDRGIGNYKFTGKERDSETGLDEFGARYYSSFYGR